MAKIRHGLRVGVVFFFLGGLAGAQETVTVPVEIAAYPDLVLYNGKVVTMDDTSFGLNTPIGTVAEAIAASDESRVADGGSLATRH